MSDRQGGHLHASHGTMVHVDLVYDIRGLVASGHPPHENAAQIVPGHNLELPVPHTRYWNLVPHESVNAGDGDGVLAVCTDRPHADFLVAARRAQPLLADFHRQHTLSIEGQGQNT